MPTASAARASGLRAESLALSALDALPPPWLHFHAVEWRTLQHDGERIGEADVIVFHPQHGLIVFEIKAGAVEVRDGPWYCASGLAMKQSPLSQARSPAGLRCPLAGLRARSW